MTDPTANFTWNPTYGCWQGTLDIPTLKPYCNRWSFSDTRFFQHYDFERRQRDRKPEFPLSIKDRDHRGIATAQRDAVTHFQTNESRLCDLFLTGLLKFGREQWSQHFEFFSGPDLERRMRDKVFSQLDGPGGLREVVQLVDMIVLEQSRDGVSYIMFDFNCGWDWGHGSGILIHKDQIIKIDVTMHLLGAIDDWSFG